MKAFAIVVFSAWAALAVALTARAQSVRTIYSFTNSPAVPQAGLTLGPDGNFYGTTSQGGSGAAGTVFRMTTNGAVTTLVNFNKSNGANPVAGLTLGPDGNFYGTTSGDNISTYGTVFRVTTNGTLTTLVSFNSINGSTPKGGLTLGPDGNFYGTTSQGGYGYGTVFQMTTNGTLTTLVIFNGGGNPYAGLTLGPDGNFYGTTQGGGSGNFGTVFQVTTNGTLTTLASFNNSNGAFPKSSLTLGPDGNFYGTTYGGGSGGWGTVFQVTTNGTLTTLVNFDFSSNGGNPQAGLTQGPDGNLYGATYQGGSSFQGTVFRMTTNGTLTTLVNFNTTNGSGPAGLALGLDGNFYGTTANGGRGGLGTVFQVTTNGALTTLASFADANGINPHAGLTLGPDGNLYGTTEAGGLAGNNGTAFQLTTNGTLTTLVNFDYSNGANPSASLTLGPDGNLYGTTPYGGSTGPGTVFQMTTNGTLTTLVSFQFSGDGGGNPYASLTLGPDGNFYGTAFGGGSGGNGTVFRVTTNGAFTTMAGFLGANGGNPRGSLALGPDGNFYGTTFYGGDYGYGTVFQMMTNGTMTTLVTFSNINGGYPQAGLTLGPDGNLYGTTTGGGTAGNGTVFQVTTNGIQTTLVNFNYVNGAIPYASLTLGPDGNLYGTTYYGGSSFTGNSAGYGTVFEVSTNGTFTLLASFNGTNGATPYAGLTLGADGNLYGTTYSGGSGGGGTIFQLELPPEFVANPTSQTAPVGGSATFNCQVFGTGPLSYQWLSNGVPIAGATNGSLTVTNVSYQTAINGQFQVVVTSALGSITSSAAMINLPLSIIIQPADQTVSIGSPVVFSPLIAGPSPRAYQWYFNGVLLPGATNATLAISPVLLHNMGNYELVVTNSTGSVTSRWAALNVLLQPNSYAISNSGGGNFMVYLAGTPNTRNRLWATTNLALPFAQWQLIATPVTDFNGLCQFLDTNTAGMPRKFYRLSYP